MGDRIAQLIIEKLKTPKVKELDSLEGTDRGAKGYGSTGMSAEQKNEVGKCQNVCRQLSSNVAAARPQPLLLGQTRESQSHKLSHRKKQRQPRDCPTDQTRC